jgi:hypothetical protein
MFVKENGVSIVLQGTTIFSNEQSLELPYGTTMFLGDKGAWNNLSPFILRDIVISWGATSAPFSLWT